MSLAKSFASAASSVCGAPWSFRVAAFQVRSRAASISVAMSASFHWIAWKSAIFLPKASRSFAYASASSRQARAMPTACAAIPMRPPSRVDRASLKPPPASPSRFAAGTRQSWKTSCAVSDPRMPSLRSSLPTLKPFVPFSTTNAAMPLLPFAGSVCAKTIATSAIEPLVMKFFVPFSNQPSPSLRAVVRIAAASLPEAGSERAKHPIFSPFASPGSQRSFCASLPKRRIGATARLPCVHSTTPVLAHARLISSRTRTYVIMSRPAPPYRSGTSMPMNPSFPISAISAGGTFFFSSISAASGSTFSRAKSRAVFWTRACSSVSVRSKLSDSVLVVVAMRMVLQRIDADVASVRIAREEVVAEEIRRRGTELPRLLVRAAHIRDPEPDDEAQLARDLLRSLRVALLTHDDLHVPGVEPDLVALLIAGEPDDLFVKGGHRATEAREHHHWTDLRAVLVAHEYWYTPRPLLRPRRPSFTSATRFGAGAYFLSPRSRASTSMIATQTSRPMRSARRSGPIG